MGNAAQSRPQGIQIKPSNITLLPPQRAVRLLGIKASAVELSGQQMTDVTGCKWRNCPVPTLLGIPLALKQLAPTTHANRVDFEQPAVLMLMEPKSESLFCAAAVALQWHACPVGTTPGVTFSTCC
eukprot:GHRQ01038558.1.p1 GENE.GHRQ01038558.1~~GHRQ01038558.1.p1  ORF type:complete len:126 (+),score=28.41 GHRQ01038558.1:269-646(+)